MKVRCNKWVECQEANTEISEICPHWANHEEALFCKKRRRPGIGSHECILGAHCVPVEGEDSVAENDVGVFGWIIKIVNNEDKMVYFFKKKEDAIARMKSYAGEEVGSAFTLHPVGPLVARVYAKIVVLDAEESNANFN